MIGLNTNESSIIVQKSLKNASKSLNQAIERMTTGFKINHAKNNAANYSISNNMTSKIGAYNIAESNASMGLDMLLTAQDSLSQISSSLSKLRSLAVQAQNGTYGDKSLDAINSEASSIAMNINQIMSSAKYNGIKLLDATELELPDGFNLSNMPETTYNGFIENPVSYSEAEVNAMTSISTVESFTSGQKYSIKNADELAKLATLVDSGVSTTGAIFVLGSDIDLSAYSSGEGWNPIGDENNFFKGVFDGNGHVITNLKINRNETYQGLFAKSYNAQIKNVGIVDAEIAVSGAFGYAGAYVYAGALIGYSYGAGLRNCYMSGNVTSEEPGVGGLVGIQADGTISSSYATGNVTGNEFVGGLVGIQADGTISSSYATGNVTGNSSVGGLVGYQNCGTISSSYATGNVTGNSSVGGLVGRLYGTVSSSYATGNVRGEKWVGGLCGQIYSPSDTTKINDCISYSRVDGTKYIGSFAGGVINTQNGTSFGTINITNSKALSQGMDNISGCYRVFSYTPNTNGLDAMLAGISEADVTSPITALQVGIYGNDSSQISVDIGLQYGIFKALNGLQMDDALALSTIDEIIKAVSSKETELGSATNRLESVLEEISIKYENLVSSRSTLRDADMALESSEYIRSQILQQASATLLSTANQAPALALALLQGL